VAQREGADCDPDFDPDSDLDWEPTIMASRWQLPATDLHPQAPNGSASPCAFQAEPTSGIAARDALPPGYPFVSFVLFVVWSPFQAACNPGFCTHDAVDLEIAGWVVHTGLPGVPHLLGTAPEGAPRSDAEPTI